ncbi:MAG: zinc ABC transporter substrate-binding protein [Muribaculaceae bacterium]|nr:zinc ABC transporter substrate-binding protein [Muribaculaceae bacterium]
MFKKGSHKWFALIVIVVGMMTGCNVRHNTKPTIVVSIQPQKQLLELLVGNHYDVVCLLSENTNPETFEPNMNSMIALEQSDAYFTVGNIGYEYAMVQKARANNSDLKLYNTSEGIDVMLGGHGAKVADPHVWTSARNAKIIAGNMLFALCKLDPDNQDFYKRRYRKLSAHIDSVDNAILAQLAPLQGITFVDWHPSLSYFARDYGLNQLSLDNGKEPSARQLRTMLDVARKVGAKVFFSQSQFDSRQSKSLIEQSGLVTYEINPMNEAWDTELLKISQILVDNYSSEIEGDD